MDTRLDGEVWSRDRCTGCGMCIAACSKQVLEWGEQEHPRKRRVTKNIGISTFELDTCSFCDKFCEVVCPRLEPAARLQPLATMAARATGSLAGGEPNDVVRGLLVAARAGGMIDGALVVDADRSGTTRARIVTSAGEIAETVGFQQVWTPLLGALNEAVFDLSLKNIAIVSTPCTSQAVRRLLDAQVHRLAPYQKAIRLSIALFCTGVYAPQSIRDLLADRAGVALENVQSITSIPRTGRWRIRQWDGTVREIDAVEADQFTRAGCARCDDYVGESADVAVGSVGAPAGFATVVVRTGVGQAMVQNARTMKLIETNDSVDTAALARTSAEKDRRERAQAFDRLQLLVLEALRDPQKRALVKREFDMLYGAGRPMKKKEEYGYAGCGDCSGC